VICGHGATTTLAVIPDLPVFMGCVRSPEGHDVLSDAAWHDCPECGCLQLRSIPNPALVYMDQHNEVVGGTWRRHHAAFAAFISRYSPRRVVEIGGAHGWLAEHYTASYGAEDWLVVEPNPTFAAAGQVRIERAFIEDSPAALGSAGAVVHSHVLEHVLEPQTFIRLIAEHATEGGLQFISVPNLLRLLELDGANALNFEHTYSFDLEVVAWLLETNGYRVLEVEQFESHSFFVAAERLDSLGRASDPPKQGFRGPFVEFLERSARDVEMLNERIKSVEVDRTVFIHGAHVFTQFLVARGLEVRRVGRVLDNASGKQGKRLYGTPLAVGSMEELVGCREPVLIVRATHYSDEVIAQARTLNPGVEIW
jgi:hypothetical protein